MNKNQIFAVALKVLGIIFLFRAFGSLLQFIALITSDNQNNFISFFQYSSIGNILQIFNTLFYAIFGYLFLFRSKNVSDKLISDKSDATVSRQTILEMVVCYIGLEMSVFSLQAFVFFATSAVVYINSPEFKNNPSIVFVQTGFYIAQIIIGIYILRYYTKIASFLNSKIPENFWGKNNDKKDSE